MCCYIFEETKFFIRPLLGDPFDNNQKTEKKIIFNTKIIPHSTRYKFQNKQFWEKIKKLYNTEYLIYLLVFYAPFLIGRVHLISCLNFMSRLYYISVISFSQPRHIY